MMANPGLLLVLGALLVPLLRGRLRSAWMLALPVGALALLWSMQEGVTGEATVLGWSLHLIRVDSLSRVFATAFCVAALLAVVYALHVRDTLQQTTTLIYAGAAVGGTLAGDLVTLFVWWELTGLASVFMIWAGRTERSLRAGKRYLAAQVVSGLLMLAGIAQYVRDTGDLEFDVIGLDRPGGILILLAIGIKCAFPVLHSWLQDTYPEATAVGTVVLSAFTTKFAVYALARGFPGTEELVWIGAIMTCFPIFYAVIENDLRRVLAYSMINQLGFMVVGVGIGGPLGINGAAAHAFADIFFKGLLFMSMGAVLTRVGTVKASELGGLYKSMPQTTVLCMVGAASISAFPLFSGFATKSMIMAAVAEDHRTVIWLVLLFASAGVFHHAGIKIPFFAFFAHDAGHRVPEAPVTMRFAMGLAAAISIGIGVAPGLLYGMLPYPVEYVPYTTSHVITQLQLLAFAAMAFTVLMRTGLYPPELRAINVDADIVYRRFLPAVWHRGLRGAALARDMLQPQLRSGAVTVARAVTRPLRPQGLLGAIWSTSAMVRWVVLVLGIVLLVTYL